MNIGKLSGSALFRSVIRSVRKMNNESNAGIGVDAGLICDGVMAAVQTLCGNEDGLTELAIYRAVNSLAAAGVCAESITLSLALPEAEPEECAKKAMKEAARACVQAKINIESGNTIVTRNKYLTVTVTATGKRSAVKSEEESNGNRLLLMLGYVGTAGAAMLAKTHREELTKRLPGDFVDKASEAFDECLQANRILKLYNRLRTEHKETIPAHDVEDGGLFGAVWELCERENVGCEIDIDKIPIRQVTVEICEFFDINPYTMRGDGAMLAIVPDIPEGYSEGTVIGHITKDKNRVVILGEERRFLEPNRTDDYYMEIER